MDIHKERKWSPDTIERRTTEVGEKIWHALKLPGDPPYSASSTDVIDGTVKGTVKDKFLNTSTQIFTRLSF